MIIWCMDCGLEQECPIAVWYCRCPNCNGRCFKWYEAIDFKRWRSKLPAINVNVLAIQKIG